MSAVEEPPRTAYAYEAQTPDGQRFNGTLEAASAEEVQTRLGTLQLRVLAVTPMPPVKRRGPELGADEFLVFNQQLAHLTEAGLPVERGLRLIALDLKSGKLARAARDVATELESGVPLQEAFSRHASQFPPLYGKLVEAGASAGNLPGMLFSLGRHLELVGRLKRTLWRTLAYPIMVLAALSLVLLFIATFVLPHFEVIYNEFRTDLPALTLFMIQVAHIYPWVFAIGWGIVLAVLLGDAVARLAGTRGIPWINLLGQIPLLGGILKANLLARWIDALRLGIEAGLDLPHAMSLAAAATGDAALERDAILLTQRITQGQPLADFHARRIPATVTAAIELATAAGSGADLSSVLYSLGRMYEQQAEHRLRLMPSILTPLLLILIAACVSITILSMFLPLVKLIQSVS